MDAKMLSSRFLLFSFITLTLFSCEKESVQPIEKTGIQGTIINSGKTIEIINGFNEIDSTINSSLASLDENKKWRCKALIEGTDQEQCVGIFDELGGYIGLPMDRSVYDKLSLH